MVALSDVVDEATAEFLKGVVSDGIIAPGYDAEGAASTLSEKKGGSSSSCRPTPATSRPEREARELFGVRLVQDRNNRRDHARPTSRTWSAARSRPRRGAISCSV